MRDIRPFFINPFDDRTISYAELRAFSADHITRLTSNPVAVLTPRIAPTNAALTTLVGAFADDVASLGERMGSKQTKNSFLAALPAAIGKIAVKVEGAFGEGSSQFNQCFPAGRSIFSSCPDDTLESYLKALVKEVTKLQPPLDAATVTAATGLLTGWQAVYGPSETATGGKTTTQAAKKAARAALSLELFKNLLTLALQFPNQPAQLDLYMQPSLLGPHTPTPPGPSPVAPVLTRDANGVWTLAYDGPAQTYWQVWARSNGDPAWAKTGDLETSGFPASDADIAPDGATWWQVKLCGQDGDGKASTPFSNIIAFGPVPA